MDPRRSQTGKVRVQRPCSACRGAATSPRELSRLVFPTLVLPYLPVCEMGWTLLFEIS